MQTMSSVACTTFLCLSAVFAANAKTVALWTMDPVVKADGKKYLRCAVSPRNDLLLDKNKLAEFDQTIGWNLPPNPDTTEGLVGSSTNRSCIAMTGVSTTTFAQSQDQSLANTIAPSHDFTIEGWINIDNFPNDRDRMIVFAGTNREPGAYTLQFIKVTDESRAVRLAWRDTGSSNRPRPSYHDLCTLNYTEVTNAWHHYAFTFKYENANGKNCWTFYLDGVEKGSAEHDKLAEVAVGPRFIFGGAGTSSADGNNIVGSFDYWRISDQALQPSGFMNYGGAGTVVPADPERRTLAYWKLGRNPDGSVDTRDYVGTADLSQGFYSWNKVYISDTSFGICSVRPSIDSHDGNGSVKCLPITGMTLQHSTLGTSLTFDTAFSVQGWIKPMWRGTETAQTYLCGTLDNYSGQWRGWLLIIKQDANGYRFLIGAQDGSGTDSSGVNERGNLTMGSSGFNNAAVISPYYAFDEQWVKLRLSYTPASAGENLWNGTWTLHVNDVQAGTAVHAKTFNASVAPTKGTFPCFFLGGASRGGQFHGLLDDWSVSVAGSEVAHWPLDVAANGVDMDLTDERGTYNFATVRNTCISANVDGPSVTNPDNSATFDGNPSINSGSTRIASTQDKKGYMAVYDDTMLTAIRAAKDWTFEGWVRRDGTYTGNGWGIVFGLSKSVVPNTDGNVELMLRVNATGGFSLVDTIFADGHKSNFLADYTLPENTWVHVALVRSHRDVDGTEKATYRFYVNGELKSTGDEHEVKATPEYVRQLVIGGDPGQDTENTTSDIRTFPGSVSSFRLSIGVLSPSEFLNASPAPGAAATLAYWPLDNDAGAVDGSVAVGKVGYELCLGGKNASGSAAMARKRLKTAGVPSANDGSILVASNPLAADYVGAFLRPSSKSSWSVEGYFKNDAGGMVCRMGDAGCGWQLDYEPAMSRFSLSASPGSLCFPCAGGTFPATSVEAGEWNHLLLTYDVSGAMPVWSLFVNACAAGTVTNAWSGASSAYGETFALGKGAFDLWRVSSGIVSVGDSLYRPVPGLIATFR